jgi:hypothetical protein
LRQLELVPAAVQAHHRQLVTSRDQERRKLRAVDATEQALLDSLPEDPRERWDEILAKPLASSSVWIGLLSWAGEPVRCEALTAFLAAADDKDLLEWTEHDVRAHVSAALAVRHRLAEAWGLSVPDSIWREGILTGRIAREPGCDWRTPLPEWPLGQDAESTIADWCQRFAARVDLAPDGMLGQPLAPHQTWQLGQARRGDWQVCFVGLCRRAGLPARWRHGRIDVWDGAWREVRPVPAAEDGPPAASEPPGRGWLAVQLTRGGLSCPDAEPYRRFMVAERGEGLLEHRWWDVQNGLQLWDAGPYVLGTVTRVPGGSACGRLRSFDVAAAETTRVSLALDIDASHWDASVLVEAPLVAALTEALRTHDREPDLKGRPDVFLLGHAGEDLQRMITALGRVWPRLRAEGCTVIVSPVGATALAPLQQAMATAGLPSGCLVEGGQTLESFLDGPARQGPLAALWNRDGDCVLLRVGVDNDLDETMHLALDGVDGNP